MRKVDSKAQLKAVVGLQSRPFEIAALALLHRDRRFDADKAPRRVLHLDTGALQ